MINEPVSPGAPKGANKLVYLPVSSLLLDPENPRLGADDLGAKPSQSQLEEYLWTKMAVSELVLSIAANGYFPEEPLFVIPSKTHEGKHVVLEGNRRLAAVRILLDDRVRERLRAGDVPQLSETEKSGLSALPAYVYPTRQELWAFLSFRHINAPQEWDAYSKAKFVARVHEEYGVELDEIARRIGDEHETVRRLYRGYKVLRQAERTGTYSVTERYADRFYFSHLYTALAYREFQEFLGVDRETLDAQGSPVPDTHLSRLGELLRWIYGAKSLGRSGRPIVQRQNPDLNYLRAVIAHPEALDTLRSGMSLDRAHQVSLGDPRRFREALVRSKEELMTARGLVTSGYDGDPQLLTVMQDIHNIVDALQRDMAAIAQREEEAS